MSSVEYKGIRYPVRQIYIPEIGIVSISVTSLGSKLIGEDGIPLTKEAEMIDYGIFYYVDDSLINGPESELVKHIKENI